MGLRYMAAAVALTGLAACESTGDGSDPFDDFEDRVGLNDDLAEDVAALPVAAAGEVPTSGGATYDGYAGIVLDTDGTTALIGDAALAADFGDETIEGEVDNFVGRVEGGSARAYDGSLAIEDGATGIVSASGFGADVNGVITGGGDVVGVDGSIFGTFRTEGSRDASALTAISSGGTDFSLNGEDEDGLLSIVAER